MDQKRADLKSLLETPMGGGEVDRAVGQFRRVVLHNRPNNPEYIVNLGDGRIIAKCSGTLRNVFYRSASFYADILKEWRPAETTRNIASPPNHLNRQRRAVMRGLE